VKTLLSRTVYPDPQAVVADRTGTAPGISWRTGGAAEGDKPLVDRDPVTSGEDFLKSDFRSLRRARLNPAGPVGNAVNVGVDANRRGSEAERQYQIGRLSSDARERCKLIHVRGHRSMVRIANDSRHVQDRAGLITVEAGWVDKLFDPFPWKLAHVVRRPRCVEETLRRRKRYLVAGTKADYGSQEHAKGVGVVRVSGDSVYAGGILTYTRRRGYRSENSFPRDGVSRRRNPRFRYLLSRRPFRTWSPDRRHCLRRRPGGRHPAVSLRNPIRVPAFERPSPRPPR
jgi:hypothetical protein